MSSVIMILVWKIYPMLFNIKVPLTTRLYQQSHVLFLPLKEATANNALVEGLSCGLPIVTTLLPSVREYIPFNHAILIKNNNVDDFVNALLYLYNNPLERERMGIESRKRAEELDWKNIIPHYGEVYDNVIG